MTMPDTNTLFERIAALATAGRLAVPIWIAFLCILLSFMRGPVLSGILRLFKVDDQPTIDSVRKRLNGPMQVLFIALGLLPFTLLIKPPYGGYVVFLTRVFVIFLAFHILIQSVDLTIFSWYLKRTRANVSSVMRFFTLTVLYAIAVMLVMEWEIGVSILPLLATSTVLTAVLGLALQDTLKNAFAGLNMSLENSFEQGDWVMFRLDSTEQWFGQIVEIGWRTTKIKTQNNNYAVIPNSTFTAHELINFNKPSAIHARTVDFPIMLTGDGERVREIIQQAARSVPGVLEDPPPEALPTLFKQDRIVYQLRFWLENIEQREVITGKVIERCWQELKDLGALY
jgi:small-conductance mechanosensitive channel